MNFWFFQRVALGETNIFEKLGHGFKNMSHLTQWPARFAQAGEKLEGCKQTITRGRIICHHHMARLFPAKIITSPSHFLNDISVPHLGSDKPNMFLGQSAFQTKIGHDRGHNSITCQHAPTLPIKGNGRHQLIPINLPATLVNQNHPISVPIKGDAHVSPGFQNAGFKRGK